MVKSLWKIQWIYVQLALCFLRSLTSYRQRRQYLAWLFGPQNTTQKTEECSTRTPLKVRGELTCFGKVTRSCSTNGAGTIYMCYFCQKSGYNSWTRKQREHIHGHVTQIFRNDGIHKTLEVMISTWPCRTRIVQLPC